MEKFLALPEAKKNGIMDAAMMLFGKMGYKKASAKDIAIQAGISKSMLFHYFGSKKNLYLYLVEYAGSIMMAALSKMKQNGSRDFFERVQDGTNAKLAIMNKHPALGVFLTSVYQETDDEVASDIQRYWGKAERFRSRFALEDLDVFKFKDTVKPELVLDLLVKYAEGYWGNMSGWEELDLTSMIERFTDCLSMLRQNFYKEEYL